MSPRRGHWSVATAKARLSELIDQARERPQTIARRGKAMVVVVSVEQYEEASEAALWKKFLVASAALREEGGGELSLPRRRPRASPFGRT